MTSRSRKLRTSLLAHGYELIESRDRAGVYQSIQTRKPDLVIVAFRQNEAGEEFELTDQIRRLDRRLPIIWTTPQPHPAS